MHSIDSAHPPYRPRHLTNLNKLHQSFTKLVDQFNNDEAELVHLNVKKGPAVKMHHLSTFKLNNWTDNNPAPKIAILKEPAPKPVPATLSKRKSRYHQHHGGCKSISNISASASPSPRLRLKRHGSDCEKEPSRRLLAATPDPTPRLKKNFYSPSPASIHPKLTKAATFFAQSSNTPLGSINQEFPQKQVSSARRANTLRYSKTPRQSNIFFPTQNIQQSRESTRLKLARPPSATPTACASNSRNPTFSQMHQSLFRDMRVRVEESQVMFDEESLNGEYYTVGGSQPNKKVISQAYAKPMFGNHRPKKTNSLGSQFHIIVEQV